MKPGAGSRAAALRTIAARRVNGFTQLGGEHGRLRPFRRLDRKRSGDHGEQTRRQVGPFRLERRSPGLDRGRDLRQGNAPERVLARERLPEHHADRPHVARRRGLLTAQAFGRDVRKRSRNVADVRQRVGLVELGETEVEQLDRDLGALLDEDVRRLHVAMNDSARVGVSEAVEHLCRGLDGVTVGEGSVAERIAECAAGDVLVGDVDVALVAAEVVRADAPLMTQP